MKIKVSSLFTIFTMVIGSERSRRICKGHEMVSMVLAGIYLLFMYFFTERNRNGMSD